ARTPFFGKHAFASDAGHDAYRCPGGQELRFRKHKYTERTRVYQAPAAACNACLLKTQCTDSAKGRQLRRSFDEAYLERVRGYHATEAYKKAMRKRQVWVEPLFAEAKDWHSLRRFRLRGLANVNIEGLLIAAGQNLKRLLAAMGWGRRHAPAAASWPSPGTSCCRSPPAADRHAAPGGITASVVEHWSSGDRAGRQSRFSTGWGVMGTLEQLADLKPASPGGHSCD
ncbi:MAG: transposase, partial [Thermomicrobiales bacterium]